MKEKTLVLFSGGQDSTVCLLMAISKYGKENVEAISYIYNQKNRTDIECAKSICRKLGIKQHIYDIGIIKNIAETNNFEGRNLLLVSLAAIYASTHKFNQISIGVAAEDVIGSVSHPDCSLEFVEALKKCLSIALDTQLELLTPLIKLKKEEIWKLADEMGYLDFVKEETFSCWNNGTVHCMKCRACELRFEGLMKYERIKYGK